MSRSGRYGHTEIGRLNKKIARHKARRAKLQLNLLGTGQTPERRAKREAGVRIHTEIIAHLKALREQKRKELGLPDTTSPEAELLEEAERK